MFLAYSNFYTSKTWEVKDLMVVYFSTTPEWMGIGWTIIVFDVLTMPLILFQLYVYYLHRNLPFFRARVPKTTMYIVLIQNVIIIHRMLDSLIGMGIMADNWFIGVLITYIEFFPWAVLYTYKFCFEFSCPNKEIYY